MRLLLYLDTPFFSGAESQAIRIARRGAKLGHSIYFDATVGKGVSLNSNLEGVFVSIRETILNVDHPKWIEPSFDAFRFFAGVGRGFRKVRKLRPDVVHIINGGYPGSHGARGFALGAALASKGQRIFFSVNNIAVGYNSFLRWLDRPIDILLARKVHAWITASNFARDSLKSLLQSSSSCITVVSIPNGIPRLTCDAAKNHSLRSLPLLESDTLILSVGHLERRKGHDLLIRAIAQLRLLDKWSGGWKLIIEGRGRLMRPLRELVSSLELEDIVQFSGGRECLACLFSQTSLLVHPSRSNEDMPNVITEAMAYGIPAVGANLAGIPQQIEHGTSGLITEVENVDEIARAIELILSDHELRAKMGAFSLKKYKKEFNEEIALSRYFEIYEGHND